MYPVLFFQLDLSCSSFKKMYLNSYFIDNRRSSWSLNNSHHHFNQISDRAKIQHFSFKICTANSTVRYSTLNRPATLFLIIFFRFLIILCVWIFWFYVCIYNTCVQCLRRSEEGITSPGTRVTDHCEPLKRSWELN